MPNPIIQSYLNDRSVDINKRRYVIDQIKNGTAEDELATSITRKYGDKYGTLQPTPTQSSADMAGTVAKGIVGAFNPANFADNARNLVTNVVPKAVQAYGKTVGPITPEQEAEIEQKRQEANRENEKVSKFVQQNENPDFGEQVKRFLFESPVEVGIRGNKNLSAEEKMKALDQAKNPIVRYGENTASAANQNLEQAGSGGSRFFKGMNPFDQSQSLQERNANIAGGFSDVVGGAIGTAFSPVTGGVESLPEQVKEPIKGAMNFAFNEVPTTAVKKFAQLIRPDLDVEDPQFQETVIKPFQAAMQTYLTIGAPGAKAVINKAAQGAKKVLGKTGELAKTTKDYALTQATGLNPETLSTAVKNPQLLSKAQKIGVEVARDNVFQVAKNAIDDTKSALSSKGKGYQKIREGSGDVILPKKWMESKIQEGGLKIVKGKIQATAESTLRNAGDIKALQSIYDLYKGKTKLSRNEYLNFRDDWGTLSKFGKETTKDIQPFAKSMRKELNDLGRPQIEGLKDLDISYAKIKNDLSKVEKAIYKKDGSLQENAVSNINNLLNKGKEIRLENIKKVIPNFDEFVQQIKVVKALEDIQIAKGQKVGTYVRGAAGGLALTGNVPALAYAILSNPVVVVKILKSYGKLKGMKPKSVDSLVGKIKKGIKPNGNEATFIQEAFKKVKASAIPGLIQSNNGN